MQLLMNSSCKSFVKFSVPLFSMIQSVQTSTSIISLEELFILTKYFLCIYFLSTCTVPLIDSQANNFNMCLKYFSSLLVSTILSEWLKETQVLRLFFTGVVVTGLALTSALSEDCLIWEMNRLLTINYYKVTYFESKAWNYSGQENDGFLHKS